MAILGTNSEKIFRRIRRAIYLTLLLVFARNYFHQASANPVIPPALQASTMVTSWYGGNGDGFAWRPTASTQIFDPEKLTCAHKTLPFGTVLEVIHGEQRVLVTVNDRGPYIHGRDLDLSMGAARELGLLEKGVAEVQVRTMLPTTD